MKAGLFVHESLSFATNTVSKRAIAAAAHTLRLGLSRALRISTTTAGAAGKGAASERCC